jgi:hypothetical protein
VTEVRHLVKPEASGRSPLEKIVILKGSWNLAL